MPKNRPFYVAPFTGWYYDPAGVARNIYSGVPTLLYDSLGNPISSAGGAIKVALHDGLGGPITSLRGGLDIHDSDVHREYITHYLYQHLATYTLSAPITKEAYQFTVTNATGIIVGSYFHIIDNNTGAHDHELLIVTAVNTNTITVNRPLDYSYTVAGTAVNRVNREANVNGSIASPIKFILTPPPGEVWHLGTLNITMRDDSEMDDAKFGGVAALTNGVLLRVKDVNDNYDTIFHARSNSALFRKGCDLEYSTKAPAGTYGLRAKLSIKDEVDAVIRLTSTDTLELVIQDDLTGLLGFSVVALGHIEGE